MKLALPLTIRPYRGVRGEITAYIIRDRQGRAIQIHCDEDQLRRGVAKLWSPEEAEALAKRIARLLTDDENAKRASSPDDGTAG
jgi:hypothetical protein